MLFTITKLGWKCKKLSILCACVICFCLYSTVKSSITEILGLVVVGILRFYPRPKIMEIQNGINAYLSYFEGQWIRLCTTKQLRGSCRFLDHRAEGSDEDMEMWSWQVTWWDGLVFLVDWWWTKIKTVCCREDCWSWTFVDFSWMVGITRGFIWHGQDQVDWYGFMWWTGYW